MLDLSGQVLRCLRPETRVEWQAHEERRASHRVVCDLDLPAMRFDNPGRGAQAEAQLGNAVVSVLAAGNQRVEDSLAVCRWKAGTPECKHEWWWLRRSTPSELSMACGLGCWTVHVSRGFNCLASGATPSGSEHRQKTSCRTALLRPPAPATIHPPFHPASSPGPPSTPHCGSKSASGSAPARRSCRCAPLL